MLSSAKPVRIEYNYAAFVIDPMNKGWRRLDNLAEARASGIPIRVGHFRTADYFLTLLPVDRVVVVTESAGRPHTKGDIVCDRPSAAFPIRAVLNEVTRSCERITRMSFDYCRGGQS